MSLVVTCCRRRASRGGHTPSAGLLGTLSRRPGCQPRESDGARPAGLGVVHRHGCSRAGRAAGIRSWRLPGGFGWCGAWTGPRATGEKAQFATRVLFCSQNSCCSVVPVLAFGREGEVCGMAADSHVQVLCVSCSLQRRCRFLLSSRCVSSHLLECLSAHTRCFEAEHMYCSDISRAWRLINEHCTHSSCKQLKP